MTSNLEKLPSELLYEIGDYLQDDLNNIKSLRLSSRRLYPFGPLMEELNVYTTKESFRRLAFVAAHPVLCMQARKIICWVPFLYDTFTQRSAYDERVESGWGQIHRLPHVGRRGEGRYFPYQLDDLEEPTHVQKLDSDRVFADYVRYHAEQEEILQDEFVPQLSAALAAFPRLRTVEVALPENDVHNLKPKAMQDMLYKVGVEVPDHVITEWLDGNPEGADASEYPKEYMHKFIQAIAESNKPLKTLAVDKHLYDLGYRGQITTSLPLTADQSENFEKVFRSLRRLEYGLVCFDLDISAAAARPNEMNRLLSLAPSLEHLTLSMESYEQLDLLADLTLPRLKTLHLKTVKTSAQTLLRFLERHASTLIDIEFDNVSIDGPWKPINQVLEVIQGSIPVGSNQQARKVGFFMCGVDGAFL